MNVFTPSAYHVPRAECESGCLGVLYANGHGCKFRRVKVTVDEFLRYVSEIQVGESERECGYTVLYIDGWCVQLGWLEF